MALWPLCSSTLFPTARTGFTDEVPKRVFP